MDLYKKLSHILQGPANYTRQVTFGLEVEPRLLTVNGRVLNSPNVMYGNNQQVPPRFGSWNMSGKRFSVGSQILNWTYLQIQWGQRDALGGSVGALVEELRTSMRNCGLQVAEPRKALPTLLLDHGSPGDNFASLDSIFEELVVKLQTQMLFVILPDNGQTLYSNIKYLADVKYGIHTVCSVAAKLGQQRGRVDYLANIAHKFNLKRGGVNQQLQPNKLGALQTNKTMIVGIDVTHPSPDSKKDAPSVAGVVASVNALFGQWPASVRIQEGRKEMVTELEEMIIERLQLWRRLNNGTLPLNILVYRDGVSEGQYRMVLTDEASAIDGAIKRVYSPKQVQPKVSIVIVGKRHHTRFLPTRNEDADRSGNPKNGTVVDRGVTSERLWDFYLQSHTGLQGTARPAHYIVIKNDMKLSANAVQEIVSTRFLPFFPFLRTGQSHENSQTHNLCYLYGRATKAVSICPPAYYADLVCERARCYLHDTFTSGNEDLESVSGTSAAGGERATQWSQGVHETLANSMFYI